MSNVAEIVSVANLLITLANEGNQALAPILKKIAEAQAEGRDFTNEDVEAASESEDAARKRAEAAVGL